MILRAQIVLWLPGATDGHAKNFSLFLRPGGRFRMTPFYDVLSAEPSIATGQVKRRQAEQTAALENVDDKAVRRIFEELAETGETRMREAIAALSPDVPEAVFAPIVAAMVSRLP
jgi:serine/threonine-protein kinase HipA